MAWHGNISNPSPNPVQEPIERSEKNVHVNRAEQVRRDTDTQKNFTITLEDIDHTIEQQLNDLQLQVTDAGKEIKVPTYYGSPERWVSAQRDGYMRDKQGKIILPAIIFKRNTTATDDTLKMFNRNLVVPVRQMYSDKNKYTKFSVLIGQNSPVGEVYNTVVPSHVLLTYHFIIWTAYVAQMNKLTEALRMATSNIPYWGRTDSFRFRAKVESFGHTVELESSGERVVKTEFDMDVHAYLLPDMMTELERHKMTTQKQMTPKKIIMGMEVVQNGLNPYGNGNDNSEKWRNPNYPNLKYGVTIPAPGVVIDTTIPDESFLPGGAWAGIKVDNSPLFLRVVPVPTQQGQDAQDGDMSYDGEFFYFRTNHKWTRAPISQFTNACIDNSPLTGNEGAIEYNTRFFYIYSKGQWRRIPVTKVDLGNGNQGDIMYDQENLYIYTEGTWVQLAVSEFQ
jgi:hypothetical protein